MGKIKFFVEGVADEKFIADLLIHLKRTSSIIDFVKVNGCTKELVNNVRPQFIANTDNGGTNILIFDADSNYAETENRLLKIKEDLGIDFEMFLFPNNKDLGNLETLLEKIINPNHSSIFECFEGYQICLDKMQNGYKVPATKTKIFAYMDALLPKKYEAMAKEDKRNYNNSEHWDLDNPYLENLKEFLERI